MLKDEVSAFQIGKWKVEVFYLNPKWGFLFNGPRGRKIYLAPNAPEVEREGRLRSLPSYVQKYYTKLVREMKPWK